MSLIEFFLVFLCPWILIGLFALIKRNEPFAAIFGGILIVSLTMSALSAPYVNYLAGEGVLNYDLDRSLWVAGELPVEVYFILFAKAFLSGLLLFFIRPRIHRKFVGSKVLKFTGLGVLAFGLALAAIMARNQVSFHMGSALLWGLGLLFLEWIGGSSLMWRTKGMFTVAAGISAGYFFLVEALALKFGLWQTDPSMGLGIYIFNVPLERAVFNLLFAVLSCLGLEIFWRFCSKADLFSANEY